MFFSESVVGVHCTHGLNRTGYMVCRYMRDRLGIPAKEAIKSIYGTAIQIEKNSRILNNTLVSFQGLKQQEVIK